MRRAQREARPQLLLRTMQQGQSQSARAANEGAASSKHPASSSQTAASSCRHTPWQSGAPAARAACPQKRAGRCTSPTAAHKQAAQVVCRQPARQMRTCSHPGRVCRAVSEQRTHQCDAERVHISCLGHAAVHQDLCRQGGHQRQASMVSRCARGHCRAGHAAASGTHAPGAMWLIVPW